MTGVGRAHLPRREVRQPGERVAGEQQDAGDDAACRPKSPGVDGGSASRRRRLDERVDWAQVDDHGRVDDGAGEQTRHSDERRHHERRLTVRRHRLAVTDARSVGRPPADGRQHELDVREHSGQRPDAGQRQPDAARRQQAVVVERAKRGDVVRRGERRERQRGRVVRGQQQ